MVTTPQPMQLIAGLKNHNRNQKLKTEKRVKSIQTETDFYFTLTGQNNLNRNVWFQSLIYRYIYVLYRYFSECLNYRKPYEKL